jgi:hypothetical protein
LLPGNALCRLHHGWQSPHRRRSLLPGQPLCRARGRLHHLTACGGRETGSLRYRPANGHGGDRWRRRIHDIFVFGQINQGIHGFKFIGAICQ